ncbi:hypothetical protein [Absidia glauca]|uniref:Uncharacterized protein n=1 Tax=Absidia glauca TaxID=4829 RepID=A0A163K149_ABSGL|nr:hypothetical protein [Absidia glauca]
MLPQLSYVVAQAGVDSRPPPMLPRLTKPFYANGDSTMTTTSTATGASASVPGSGLDRSHYTPSYYMRPGSSPPPHPSLFPLPSNTFSSASSSTSLPTTATTSSTATNTTANNSTTSSMSTLSSPYVYPSSSSIMSKPSGTPTGNSKLSSSTSSSVTGPDTGRTYVGLPITPKQRKQQLSPTMVTSSSSAYEYTSSSSATTHYRQHPHPHPPSSIAPSSGHSHQQQQTSVSYASPSTAYPTYQSNDPWPHRVTAPFVEPGKSSSLSSSSQSTFSYATSTYPPYTTSPKPPAPDLTHWTVHSPSLDLSNSPRQQHHQRQHQHQPQTHQPLLYQHHYSQPQDKIKQQKKQQYEYQHQQQQVHAAPVQHKHQQQHQQRHRSRGFMVPDNDTLNDIHQHPPPAFDYQTAYTTAYPPAPSRRTEHLKEWNQLLTWMDHEFWEHSEEIYQEKLASLQQELKSLQNDTHVPFRDLVSDLEMKRGTMIADAECFLNYQLEWMEQLYEEDVAIIEEEYNASAKRRKKSAMATDAILAVIEDRKKQVREEKDDHLNEKDLIGEAYSRVTNKRTLRKRPPTEHSRTDSRKRHARQVAAHQADTNTALGKEEEELEEELLLMKMNPSLPMKLS